MRSLRLAVVIMFLGLGSAAADIRIDPPSTPKSPSPPPPTEPRGGSGGCAGRETGAEWALGVGVLVLGLAGMRRYRDDRAGA